MHPDVVEEYEEKVRARQAKAKKTPKKRAAATEAQSHAQVTSAAGASTQAGKAKAIAKGKERTHTDDYDHLVSNPYASTTSPQEDIDIFKKSSLPLHNCGFLFTWPDPDDPDATDYVTGSKTVLPSIAAT